MDGISVIICCYNSASRLPQTLNHIARQKTQSLINWEVILVNNNSTDSTEEVAKEQWKENGRPTELIVVKEPTPGLSHARIKGVNEAKYELLVFCDDDVWLDIHYLELAYEIMTKNAEIGVLGGKGEAVFESEEPFWFSTYQGGYATGVQALDTGDITERGYVWGAGMVLRKSVIQNLLSAGFSFYCSGRKEGKLLAGDDSEICKWFILVGYKLWYDENLKFQHFMPELRLNKTYLKKMHEGFILSAVPLSKYDKIINKLKEENSNISILKKRVKIELKYILKTIDKDFRKQELQYLYPLNKNYIADEMIYQIYRARENYLSSYNIID